ncbi:MAG: glycosyltransferase family 2 protein [Paludibacteraceae bacterium]|nr:glycosyltransferase family 2 protein [Paludibacteraceae bacterium]
MTAEETKDLFAARRIGVLIPTYNNGKTVAQVVASVEPYCGEVIVVNDGSTDETLSLLETLPENIHVVSYAQNRGKGYALKRGFEKAMELGLSAVVTLDSDGQHFASDLPLFAEACQTNQESLIVGSRSFLNPNMPQKSSFANKFSNFWFTVQTGIRLPDTQTGYRLYPLQRMKGMKPLCHRYEAELELLVRSAWRAIPLKSISINVFYPSKEERVTHFRPTVDFIRISLLNTLLCLLAIVYGYPSMALRKLFRTCSK